MKRAALLVLPSWASAQDASQPAASPDEIVVVANRAPDSMSKIGVSVSVLNGQAIQATQATSLSDLLEQTAVANMFAEQRPTILVHLAAKIGGILANRSYPADGFGIGPRSSLSKRRRSPDREKANLALHSFSMAAVGLRARVFATNQPLPNGARVVYGPSSRAQPFPPYPRVASARLLGG